eukprot:1151130-Pelagomonas_calceolata.AAC.3
MIICLDVRSHPASSKALRLQDGEGCMHDTPLAWATASAVGLAASAPDSAAITPGLAASRSGCKCS